MKPAHTCPVCGRAIDGPPESWPQFPFCGPKCRTIDLGRWLAGDYAVPPLEPEDDGGEDDPD